MNKNMAFEVTLCLNQNKWLMTSAFYIIYVIFGTFYPLYLKLVLGTSNIMFISQMLYLWIIFKTPERKITGRKEYNYEINVYFM